MWTKLFLLLLFTTRGFAGSLSAQFETPFFSATKDSLRSSSWAVYPEWNLSPSFDLKAGGKLGLYPTFSPDSLRYKIEAAYHPFSFLRFSVRLTHETLLTSTATLNHGLYWVTLSPLPFETFEFFVSAGWYQRMTLLTKATILPSFRSSFSEHDFAFELGFALKPTEKIRTYVKAATFEQLEVFNLNHPYGEIGGSFKTGFQNWDLFSYARYQILLGFGRLDTFSFALGAKTLL